MRSVSIRSTKALAAAGIGLLGVLYASSGSVAGASSPDHLWPIGNPSTISNPWPVGNPVGNPWPGQKLNVQQILVGTSLQHSFTPAGSMTTVSEPLSNPDDITRLGNDYSWAFKMELARKASPARWQSGQHGRRVEDDGNPVAQWDVAGKTDGVTADPEGGRDRHRQRRRQLRLYTIIRTRRAAVTQYAYSEPLPHNGGTDAISIYHGQILISASAPGTTGAPAPQPTYPAVYVVRLDPTTGWPPSTRCSPTRHGQGGQPRQLQYGKPVKLMLTDPDSNEVVPPGAQVWRRLHADEPGGRGADLCQRRGRSPSELPCCR